MFNNQPSSQSQTDIPERRSADRFPIEREVRYKVLSKRGVGEPEEGVGTTINISSNGVLFTTDQALIPGKRLELSISWPAELDNRFGRPDVADTQAKLMAELAMWTIRNQDSLPTGPQNAKYQTKWARPHNWYAPYRHGTAPVAFIP